MDNDCSKILRKSALYMHAKPFRFNTSVRLGQNFLQVRLIQEFLRLSQTKILFNSLYESSILSKQKLG